MPSAHICKEQDKVTTFLLFLKKKKIFAFVPSCHRSPETPLFINTSICKEKLQECETALTTHGLVHGLGNDLGDGLGDGLGQGQGQGLGDSQG